MEKKVYSRKILSALLAVAVVLGCLPLAVFGASAVTVDYVVSDDFSVNGKAIVDGVATDRADVWGALDLEQVILGNATAGTWLTDAAAPASKTVGTSNADVMEFANTKYSLYLFKDMRDTDVIKSFTVDLGMLGTPSRSHTAGVCVYYDPSTGESLSLVPISNNNYGLQVDYAHMVRSATGATDVNDGSIKGVTKGGAMNSNNKDLAFNADNYPNGLWMRVTVDYTYLANGNLNQIKVKFSAYKDNTYTEPAAYTASDTFDAQWMSGHFGNFLNKTANGKVVNQDFQTGVYMPSEAYGIDPAAVSIDSMKLALSRELSEADLQAKADAFKAEYADVLALEISGITAENAAKIVAALTAFNTLNDEVKALLASEGAKLAELNTAAAPFVPTEKQQAFETYYSENAIGDMSAIADPAVIEEALKLYNAIEETHKNNVADKYAAIVALVKSAYVKTTASQETVTLPGSDYAQIGALIIRAANNDSYATKIDVQFNAYQIFNNSASRLYIPFMTIDDQYLGLSFERGGTNTNNGNIQGIYVRRYMSAKVSDKISKWEAAPNDYVFSSDSFAPNQSLNGTNTSAETEAAIRALFMENPIITAENPYMRFCYEITSVQASESEALGGYKFLAYFKFAVYYDANNNGVFDADEYAITNVGYNGNKSSLLTAFKSEDTNMVPVGYRIDGDAQYKEAVVVTDLLNVAELTPAEQFVADHSSVLNSAVPNGDAALEMYIAYNALDTAVKAEVDALVSTPIETVIDNAKLRPTTNGATIRTNIDQNIAFYTAKPAAATSKFRIKEMGSVVSGLGYLVENGKALAKDVEGVAYGSKEYAAGEDIDAEVLTYLKGTDVSNSENWGVYIAARSFVVYTDGTTELVLYSTNMDEKNTENFAGEFDDTGVVIRSVNQIVRSIATAVKLNGTPALYEAHKGTANSFTDAYAGKAYDEITGTDTDGVLLVEGARNAVETVKMLVAYNDLINAIVNQ